MAKRSHTPDVIEEFESAAERMAGWIGENVWLVGGTLLLLLGSALAWGLYGNWTQAQEEAASNALDETRTAYFAALGGNPLAIEEPELANPAAAARIREEFLERFQAVANEYDGTVAGTLALFEVAKLLERLDRPDQSDEVWRRALERAAGNAGLEGLLHQRIAARYESRGAWAEAAAEHERASALDGYPLRYWALLDAARCADAAGEPERALELYGRLEREAPMLTVPKHVRTRFRELRALHDNG